VSGREVVVRVADLGIGEDEDTLLTGNVLLERERQARGLLAAGIDGKAEMDQFKVLRSTNKAFEEPAREAISKGVFKPARIKGQAVRQLVQQRISFNIGQ